MNNANTCGATGLCLEVHDLAIAKLAAGREKDFDFLREAARHGLVQRAVLLDRLTQVRDIGDEQRALAARRIRSAFRPWTRLAERE